MSPAPLTGSMGTTVPPCMGGQGLCSSETSSCLLAGETYAPALLNCESKTRFVAAASGQMPHARASPGILHPGSTRALGAACSVATSTGHGWGLPRRWGLPPAVLVPPPRHKGTPVNPGVLSSPGKKQDDHQDLPNSSLPAAACSSPAHPRGSVQRKWNLSWWRQDCFHCPKGRTNPCL